MFKQFVYIIAILLAVHVTNYIGFGYYYSGSAVADLKEELSTIYGTQYTERKIPTGTEDMIFDVKSKTFLMTSYNLRYFFNKDYEYECSVIFTRHNNDGRTIIKTITYQAVDPMGFENDEKRAHLLLSSKTEKTKNIEPDAS